MAAADTQGKRGADGADPHPKPAAPASTVALILENACACLFIFFMLVGGYALLVAIGRSSKYAPPAPAEERAFSSSCMHALGGGVVGPRGSLLHYDPRCTSELKVRGRGGTWSPCMRVFLAPGSWYRDPTARMRLSVARPQLHRLAARSALPRTRHPVKHFTCRVWPHSVRVSREYSARRKFGQAGMLHLPAHGGQVAGSQGPHSRLCGAEPPRLLYPILPAAPRAMHALCPCPLR